MASANFTLERVHTRLYKLSTAARFDREQTGRYVAVVRCTDLGQPPLATTDWAEVTTAPTHRDVAITSAPNDSGVVK